VIFSMLASFNVGEPEGILDEYPSSDVAGPDDCFQGREDPMIEVRPVSPPRVVDGMQLYPDCLWARSSCKLTDDRLTQACGLTYLSDMGSGFGQMTWDRANGGPSLDHAIWFHEAARADDWVLLHMWPRKAMGIRGLYDAAMRDRNGRLVAAVAQEHLLIHRVPPQGAGRGDEGVE
jgi:acyl-CoA thioesterase II